MTHRNNKQLGQYELVATLGSGSFSTVYRARQPSVDRDVAIKVLHTEHASPELASRFQREAQLLALLSHPNIVKIFDYGQEDGQLFLVMEYLPGGNLSTFLAENNVPWAHRLHIAEQIAAALDYAHRTGIIHRDIKMDNILLDRHGNAYLSDFGIARLLEDTLGITSAMTMLGTPTYMSPEQWQGVPPSRRSDLYMFGVLLFKLFSGRLPYEAGRITDVQRQHLESPVPDIHQVSTMLPATLSPVFHRALAKTPEARFNSAHELLAAIQQAIATGIQGAPPQPRLVNPPDSAAQPMNLPLPPVPSASPPNRLLMALGIITGLTILACCAGVGLIATRLGSLFVPEDMAGEATGDLTNSPVPPAEGLPTGAARSTPTLLTLGQASITPPGGVSPFATETPPPLLPTPTDIRSGSEGLGRPDSVPDGIIAFSSNRTRYNGLYIVPTGGGQEISLVVEERNNYGPAWSPDGQRIAYSSRRDGNFEVYIMNADGSGNFNLTNHLADDYDPAWAPDGGSLAFVSIRDGNREIYTINLDGSGLRNLTQHPATDWFPAFSPDGSQIAFTSERDGNADIYVMGRDGTAPRNLTNHPASDLMPAWAPNRPVLVFNTDRDGNFELYLMGTDGQGLQNLTNHAADDRFGSWSPGGAHLVFASTRYGDNDIFVLNVGNLSVSQVTSNPGSDFFPSWKPR